MIFNKLLIICLALSCGTATVGALPEVKRVILIGIDGLHVDAFRHADLPGLRAASREGAYYRESHLPLADHPGETPGYPWTCSLPNPVLHSGTVFIGKPGIKKALIQHALKGVGTGFISNDKAYDAVAIDFDHYRAFRDPAEQSQDELVLDLAREWLVSKDLRFLRLHLQSTGAGGFIDRAAGRGIWDFDSAYRERLKRADRLLGAFLEWMRAEGLFADSVVLITSDHGQSERGAHPPFEAGGDRTPLIVWGGAVREGAIFPYAEHIDLAPTMAALLGEPPPALADGRILKEAFMEGIEPPGTRWMERLNRVLREGRAAAVRAGQPLPEAFLGIREIGAWHEAETKADLPFVVRHNEKVLAGFSARSALETDASAR